MNPKDDLEQYEATEGLELVQLLKVLSPLPVERAPATFMAEVLARLEKKQAQQKSQTTIVELNPKIILNRKKEKQPYFETSFLAMAAADQNSTIAGERKDQSGEWILRIFTDRDNPQEGYILLEVCEERAAEFEGKVVTLNIGTQAEFSSKIHLGEATKEVTLDGSQADASWHIQIE